MPTQKNIFDFEPIQRFIQTLGKDIERYFGKDKGAIVYLKPDGVWYAEGLYQWLKKKKKDVTITAMEDDGEGLEEGKVQERKVLIVINESFSGKAHKRSMEAVRTRKERLKIKGIKFAAYRDRPGTADFSVDQYSAELVWRVEDLDAKDFKILQHLAKNGRESFAEIGKRVNLSPVAVKSRVDRLVQGRILQIRGALNIEQLYSLSAHILIEGDAATIDALTERLEGIQEVYHIVKLSAGHNLSVSVLGHGLEEIEEFVDKEIRSQPGVRHAGVRIGGVPRIPKTVPPQL